MKQDLEDCRQQLRKSEYVAEQYETKYYVLKLEHDSKTSNDEDMRERTVRAEKAILHAAEEMERNEMNIKALSDQLEDARKERDQARQNVELSASVQVERLKIELAGSLELLRLKDQFGENQRRWQNKRVYDIESTLDGMKSRVPSFPPRLQDFSYFKLKGMAKEQDVGRGREERRGDKSPILNRALPRLAMSTGRNSNNKPKPKKTGTPKRKKQSSGGKYHYVRNKNDLF